MGHFAWPFGSIAIVTSVAIAAALPEHPYFLGSEVRAKASIALSSERIEPSVGDPASEGTYVPSSVAHGASHAYAVSTPAELAVGVAAPFVGDLKKLVDDSPSLRTLRLNPLAPPYAPSGTAHFELRIASAVGRIERALFEAAEEAGLPDQLTTKLAEIFGWDIDFALDTGPGDAFTVIYQQRYWLGRKLADGPILAAEFVNRGRTYRAIAYRGENGRLEYYSPTGRNLKRAFLRTPVKFSRVSSPFSASRYHPILKLRRAHNGVDYAAAPGTPVRATAAGRVALLGWNGGYGKTIVLDHGEAQSTLYAHLSDFRRELKAGDRVTQGEIIGYVGQTGLANGPHLHYEFRVNGHYKDPLTYDFASGEPLRPDEREAFLRVAEESLARLQLAGDRHLATAEAR